VSTKFTNRCPADDNFDDNRDDSCAYNAAAYSPKVLVNRLVRSAARSWQCGGQGFESP
jgi:hypothetical protein